MIVTPSSECPKPEVTIGWGALPMQAATQQLEPRQELPCLLQQELSKERADLAKEELRVELRLFTLPCWPRWCATANWKGFCNGSPPLHCTFPISSHPSWKGNLWMRM